MAADSQALLRHSGRREFVVRWKRHGLSPRQTILQSHEAAQRLSLKLQGRMEEVYPDLDPDGPWCCEASNYHCGCGGASWRAKWEEHSARIPPLVRLTIASRTVGEWEHVDALQPAPFPSKPVAVPADGGDLPW